MNNNSQIVGFGLTENHWNSIKIITSDTVKFFGGLKPVNQVLNHRLYCKETQFSLVSITNIISDFTI